MRRKNKGRDMLGSCIGAITWLGVLSLVLEGAMTLYAFSGRSTPAGGFFRIALCLLVILLAVLVILGLLSGNMHREILRRLHLLADGREAVEDGAPAEKEDQMWQLLQQYSSLLSQKYLSIVAEDNGIALGLRSQMDPHFLYNSLDSIRGQALAEGSTDIAGVIEALAIMTLDTFQSKELFRSFEDELSSVHNYLRIQRFRVGDIITFVEDTDPADNYLMGYRLPTLTLQPIVENAINHGLDGYANGGCVTLRTALTNLHFMILISDNGCGMAEEAVRRMNDSFVDNSFAPVDLKNRRSAGIALLNINARIKYYYGGNFGLHINSVLGGGTTVEVRLPMEGRPNEAHES